MMLCCREISRSVAWECRRRFAPSYRFTPALNILRGIYSAKFLQVRKHEMTVSPSLDVFFSHSYLQPKRFHWLDLTLLLYFNIVNELWKYLFYNNL